MPIAPLPPFPRPIFHASLAALILSLWGAHVIGGTFYAWWFVPEGMGMMFLGWLVSVPCVVVASWVAARWRGVDKEWLVYNEMYVEE